MPKKLISFILLITSFDFFAQRYFLDDSTKVRLHFKKGNYSIGLDFSSIAEDNRAGTYLGWQNRYMPRIEYYIMDKFSFQSGLMITHMIYATKKEYDIITTDVMFGLKYDLYHDRKSFNFFIQNMYLYGSYAMLYDYSLNNDFGKNIHKIRPGFGINFYPYKKLSVGAYYFRNYHLSKNPNYDNFGWFELSVRYFLR